MNSKNLSLISLVAITFILSGCFAPINSVYDNAQTLEKKEFRVQGNYSQYYGMNYIDEFSSINNNYGISVGYGFSDNFNLYFRYERLDTRMTIKIFDEDLEIGGLNYYELGTKFRLKEDKIAMGIPIGLYEYEGGIITSLDPRVFFTFRKNDKFEFNLVPKMHFFFGDGVGIYPALSLGFGLSSNLDKWAIRPEIGFDYFFNWGIGFNYNFNSR